MKHILIFMGMVMASMMWSVAVMAQTVERINGEAQRSGAKCITIGLEDLNPTKCWSILKDNPTDTLVAESTFLIDKAGMVGGVQVEQGDTLDATFRVYVVDYEDGAMHVDSIYRRVTYVEGAPRTVYSYSEVNLIKTLADRAWAEFRAFTAKGYEYDARFLTAEAGGVVVDSIPEKWIRKYGLMLTGGGSIFWNGSPEYTYNIGIQFLQKYWMVSGSAGRTWVRQNSNSKLEGHNDHAWMVEALAYAKYPLDKYAHWQVGLGGGFHWHTFETNSKDQKGGSFSSSGHERAMQAGAIIIFRPHCSGFNFELSGGIRETKSLYQNEGEKKRWRPYVGLTIAYNLSSIGL